MGGNLFTHAMSAAEVQSHEVWLKRKVKTLIYSNRTHCKFTCKLHSEREPVQAHSVGMKPEFE